MELPDDLSEPVTISELSMLWGLSAILFTFLSIKFGILILSVDTLQNGLSIVYELFFIALATCSTLLAIPEWNYIKLDKDGIESRHFFFVKRAASWHQIKHIKLYENSNGTWPIVMRNVAIQLTERRSMWGNYDFYLPIHKKMDVEKLVEKIKHYNKLYSDTALEKPTPRKMTSKGVFAFILLQIILLILLIMQIIFTL